MEDGSPERVSHVAFSVRLAEPEASVVGAQRTASGSASVIRRCRFNVRSARNRRRLGDL